MIMCIMLGGNLNCFKLFNCSLYYVTCQWPVIALSCDICHFTVGIVITLVSTYTGVYNLARANE